MRLEFIRKIISQDGLDAFLVTAMSNVRYLTGFSGSFGICLISHNKNIFFTDGRYKIQAEKEVHDWDIVADPSKLIEALKGFGKIGLEGKHVTCSYLEKLKVEVPKAAFVTTNDVVEKLRIIKDQSELKVIKEAISIAQEAYLSWLPSLKEGAEEKKLALELEIALQERGDDISFKAIVASGLRSAMPHAKPSSKKIENGDMVVVDFGVKYKGYCSDTTRTIIVGRFDEGQEIFNIVKGAQEEVIKHARPGMSCGDVDALARGYIEKAGWGESFSHGTGHGVGLDIHENPTIGKDRSDLIEEGMVFTVEPGIYHPELGGVRIEDMVYVRENGLEVLTLLPY